MTQCFAWKTSLGKGGYDTLNVKIPDFVTFVYLTFGGINGNCNQTLRKSGLENKALKEGPGHFPRTRRMTSPAVL